MRMPAVLTALPMLAGAAAAVLLSESIPERFIAASAGAAALALVASFGFVVDDDAWGAAASLTVGFSLAGFSMGTASVRELSSAEIARWFDTRVLQSPSGVDHDPVLLEGTLRDDAARTEYGAFFVLEARVVRIEDRWTNVTGGVRLAVGGTVPDSAIASWRAGRVLRMPALLRRPQTFDNPGVPDETVALARRRIALLGSVKSAALVEMVEAAGPIEEVASAVRAWVRGVIHAHVDRLSARSTAIALSILIGDRTGLSDEDERRLQDAGTYHVIAISGGNIAIFTIVLVFLGRLLRLPHRAAAALTILLLLFYGEIAGGAPSVTRAIAAAVVFLAATIVDHKGAPLNTVAVAAILGVAALPVTIVDAGFLLSFGATAGIILGMPRLMPFTVGFRGRAALTLLAATICAELAISPVAASFFSRITAAGLVVNFAAIPLMTAVQVGSLVLLAVAPSWPSATAAVAFVIDRAATGLLESSRFVELAPWMAQDVAPPPWWLCIIYYSTCALFLVKPRRNTLVLAAGAIALLALSPSVAARGGLPPGAAGRLRVVVLDVGQGDATAILLPDGSALLVDAGGLAGTSFDIGGRVIVPALRALRAARLSALVITHGDPDHIGGAEMILTRLRPDSVWEGVPVPPHAALKLLRARADASHIVWRTVRPGAIDRFGGVEIRVLHPPAPDWERQRVRNDDSVVLEVRYRDVSILLPGDIGREVENALIPSLQLAPLVILKAAHHGSATSSGDEFLDATKPRAVIFSTGKNNRFGHPAKAVVDRFARRGVEMLNTAHDGAVFVETDGNAVEVWGWNGARRLRLAARADGSQHKGTKSTKEHQLRFVRQSPPTSK